MVANLDLVRSIVADWERGDFTSAAWADDKIEFVLPDGPDPGSWTGIAAMGEAWGRRISAAESFRIEAEEFRELDDERVLVLTPVSGRSKTTGLDLGQMSRKGATLFHISNGKVTRLVPYFDRDRALADLGLEGKAVPEESTTPDLVELSERFFDAANRRDLEARLSFFAPDAVWDLSAMGVGTFEGRAAIRRFLEDWRGGYEELRYTLEEVVDLGNGVVLAVTRQDALPAGGTGGEPLREMWIYVFVWVEGMVARVIPHGDLDQAREAAKRLAKERG
jgi:ketosteroid isomerase-like protein